MLYKNINTRFWCCLRAVFVMISIILYVPYPIFIKCYAILHTATGILGICYDTIRYGRICFFKIGIVVVCKVTQSTLFP